MTTRFGVRTLLRESSQKSKKELVYKSLVGLPVLGIPEGWEISIEIDNINSIRRYNIMNNVCPSQEHD